MSKSEITKSDEVKFNQKPIWFFRVFRFFGFASPNKVRMRCGFSLVELLIVVGIIAILSVSSVVGFGSLGETLKLREVTGLIGDTIKQEELKVLRGDYEKTTIHFLRHFLVIESQEEDSDTKLLKLGTVCGDDGDGDSFGDGHYIKFNENGSLTQKDDQGRTIDIRNVTKDNDECVEFMDSEDIEWGYQLNASDVLSNELRFVHFNIQRDADGGGVWINSNVNYKIEISAPYGKKLVYDDSGDLLNGEVKIGVTNSTENPDEYLIIQQ